MKSAIVLTFHGVLKSDSSVPLTLNSAELEYTVSAGGFEQFIRQIPAHASCTVKEWKTADTDRAIILTFDDGFISDYFTVYPLLKKYNLRGTFFVTVSNIGQNNYCTYDQLHEMIDGGMEIGSHGMTHQFLTLMTYQAACTEICGSKAELEKELKYPVSSFAAVGGHYKKWMLQAAQRAGYSSFATMIPGKSIARDEFVVLKRNHIKIHHTLDYFKKTIGADTGIMIKNKMRYHFLNLTKRTVGYNRYDQIKNTIRKYRQLSHSA